MSQRRCRVCHAPMEAALLSCPSCGALQDEEPGPPPRVHLVSLIALAMALIGLPVAASGLPLPVLPSILALWLAGRALHDIRKSTGPRSREIVAHAARWLGVAGIGVRVVVTFWEEMNQPLLILLFAIPALMGVLFWAGGRTRHTPEEIRARRGRLPWER